MVKSLTSRIPTFIQIQIGLLIILPDENTVISDMSCNTFTYCLWALKKDKNLSGPRRALFQDEGKEKVQRPSETVKKAAQVVSPKKLLDDFKPKAKEGTSHTLKNNLKQ